MDTLPASIQARQSEKKLGVPYLRFKLTPQINALLPLQDTQEVFVLPYGRIAPIPNMPDGVLGLFNQRGRIFWIVDLAQILQLTPLDDNRQQYNIALIKVGQISLGLAVEKVQGVIRLTAEAIQPFKGKVDARLSPYLQGCVLQGNEAVLVLDTEAIVSPAVWQSNLDS